MSGGPVASCCRVIGGQISQRPVKEPSFQTIRFSHFRELHRQVGELELQIKAWHRESTESQRLEAIPGVGPITASALVASIGDAKTFKNGRQLAAWLGLVPRQNSSGGKERLLGISKRGDTYLRTLLIHGAPIYANLFEGDDATGEGNLCSQTSIDCWAKIPAIAPCDDARVTEGKKGVVRSPAA